MRFIDKLRELLLPTLALTILATLWVVAKARNSEADLARGLPPAPQALLDRAARSGGEEQPAAVTAKTDTSPVELR